MNKLYVIALVILLATPVTAQTDLVKNDDAYDMLILAEGIEYTIFDLNELDQNVTEILESDNKDDLAVNTNEFNVDKNTLLNINFVSGDRVHGLGLAELGIKVVAQAPPSGEEYGLVSETSGTFPDEDVILETNATVPGPTGTEEMKITFIVGDPGIFQRLSFYVPIISLAFLILTYRSFRKHNH